MIEWQERFNIGVENIDSAHQELFRIINKLHKIAHMGGDNAKWTASQTIKYVHSYALKHFQDEEAYMVSINFRDYEAHKAVHTAMREKIIPRLYAHLEQENYSVASIEFFLKVLEKWLVKHIIGHDRELIRKPLDPAADAVHEENTETSSVRRGKTASGNLSDVSHESIKPAPASRGRMRIFFLPAVTLIVFAIACGAGGLLVKSRVDKLAELKTAGKAAETALAELRAAGRAEEAALNALRSETWGIRLMTFPDGTKRIILPKGMKYERHGKIQEGEYAGFEEIVVK